MTVVFLRPPADDISFSDSYIHRTQIMQSEALGHAYRSWRREWRGRGKEYVSIPTILIKRHKLNLPICADGWRPSVATK